MATARISPRSPTAGFLAWPAASSLVFLLSAASLLGGVWGILAPGIDDSARIGERFAAVGILHLYQVALLAVGWLLCRWRGGNPDAIGIAVLVACFAIGSAAGLDTLATDRPLTTLALGFASLPLLGLGGWWLVRHVLGRMERSLAIAAAALCAWHALAPGWLGWSFTADLDDVAHRDPQGQWLSGLWLSAAVAAALLPVALLFAPAADRGQPFLRRAGMRWVLILVLLVAGVLHLLLLDHAFSLERGVAACLMPLALALVAGNELRRRTWGDAPGWDLAAIAVPGLAALVASVTTGGGDAAGMDVIATPAAAAGAVGIAAFALGRTRPRMIDLGLGAALVAVLTTGAESGWNGLRWNPFLLAAPVALVLLAVRHRRHEFALGAVIVAAYAVVMLPEVVLRLLALRLAPAAVLAVVGGGGVLALTVFLPRIQRPLARTAAWGFALGAYHCCLREASALHAPILGVGAVLVALGAVAGIRRDAVVLAPLALPIAGLLRHARLAWLGVGGAFALLGVGAWLSWRRIRRAPPASTQDGTVTERLPQLDGGLP